MDETTEHFSIIVLTQQRKFLANQTVLTVEEAAQHVEFFLTKPMVGTVSVRRVLSKKTKSLASLPTVDGNACTVAGQ